MTIRRVNKAEGEISLRRNLMENQVTDKLKAVFAEYASGRGMDLAESPLRDQGKAFPFHHMLIENSLPNARLTIRHACYGQLRARALGIEPYWVAYIVGFAQDRVRLMELDPRFRRATLIGVGGTLQRLPSWMRAVESELLPRNTAYYGFEWFGFERRIDVDEIKSFITGISVIFDAVESQVGETADGQN